MEILDRIEQDLVSSLKAKDELTTLVLRQLKTVLVNAQIANDRKDLTEDHVVKLFRSEVKKRKEAAELYTQGGRAELAAKELAEIEIVNRYLPAEMSEQKIAVKIDEVIKQLGATGPQATGKVMAAVMKELGNAASGSVVSALVKQKLS